MDAATALAAAQSGALRTDDAGIPTTVPSDFYRQAQTDMATQYGTARYDQLSGQLDTLGSVAQAKDAHDAFLTQIDSDLMPQAALADAGIQHRAIMSKLDDVAAQASP